MKQYISGDRKVLALKIGEVIKKLRRRKGWTQEVLAEKSSITTQYIGYLERGVKCPNTHTLFRIEQALGPIWEKI